MQTIDYTDYSQVRSRALEAYRGAATREGLQAYDDSELLWQIVEQCDARLTARSQGDEEVICDDIDRRVLRARERGIL